MDRTSIVPSHEGPNVLPNSPLFSKLLRHAHRNRLAIRDVNVGVEKTYTQLLSDVLALRFAISREVDSEVLKSIRNGDEVYIGVLALGGYEFAVAVIAILALGAAMVPLSTSISPEEAKYIINKAKIKFILTSSEAEVVGKGIAHHLGKNHGAGFVQILPLLEAAVPLDPTNIVISSGRMWDENAAGIVIFTSGTTGRPKGAVMRRYFTHETALAIGDGYDIDHHDILLHVLPVHHVTGLATSFFAFLVAGACIEFWSGPFDAEWVWNRFIEGDVTVFSGVPTIYQRLQWFYEQMVASSPKDAERYNRAANRLRILMTGSSPLQEPVQEFWTRIRSGRPILTRYGATEYPGCIKMPANVDSKQVPLGCVGMPVPGVEIKLSEGDTGELLVRSPHMFSKYLFDKEATRLAHDENGFFKTGDVARREGSMYFIIGRSSVDIIKSGGYKISAIDVERECLQLPYVSEVVVVGVDDQEFGQRVAAIISTRAGSWDSGQSLTIHRLRDDLRPKLSSYKLPTLLRLVAGELPKGQTGKLQKKVLGPKFFPTNWKEVEEVQRWSQRSKSKL